MNKILRNSILLVTSILIIGTTLTGCTSLKNKPTTIQEKVTEDYSNKFFKVKKIDTNIYRIAGVNGELMYLVEGKKKAALIDTGTGIGNLKEVVEKITNKPIIVLLTHGHVDHAPGSALFDNVYMSFADKALYKEHDTMQVREGFTAGSYKDAKSLTPNDYIPIKTSDNFKDLKDGATFKLGGTTLEAIAAPGHTFGMTAILIKEKRVLLTGDACNFSTFLFDNTTLGLTSYQNSMKNLLKRTDGKFDKIYISHMSGDAPKTLVSDMINLIDEIKAGKADNIPFEFMGMKAFIAKKVDANFMRVDGGTANVVYNPKKINE